MNRDDDKLALDGTLTIQVTLGPRDIPALVQLMDELAQHDLVRGDRAGILRARSAAIRLALRRALPARYTRAGRKRPQGWMLRDAARDVER